MINIKLDKTGGLTEALRLARAAKEIGCKLMVTLDSAKDGGIYIFYSEQLVLWAIRG